jgi:hypothetical protein
LHVPGVVTLTVIVCDTLLAGIAVPTVIDPFSTLLQDKIESITALPPEDAFRTDRSKVQDGDVLSMKRFTPEVGANGMPEAVNTMGCDPGPGKFPSPKKKYPLSGAVTIFQDPAVRTLAIIVCDTPDARIPANNNPLLIEVRQL